MPLFRRNHRADPPPWGNRVRDPGPSHRAAREETDWRSYDTVADAYARVHAPRTALVAKDLVEVAGVGPGDRVLDVGAGTGVAAEAAAEAAGPEGLAVALDPSVPMLAVGAASRPTVRFVAASAIDLPFRDATFTHVLSVFSLSHMTKYDTALFDMLRVLRPGGRMGVVTWAEDEDEFSRAWTAVAEEFAEKEILADARARAMPWSDRFSHPDELKSVLHDAGVRNMVLERRDYHFHMTAEDYLQGREALTTGRFLHQMLGEELWGTLRGRARDVFAERFPDHLNDFRKAILVAGFKPAD